MSRSLSKFVSSVYPTLSLSYLSVTPAWRVAPTLSSVTRSFRYSTSTSGSGSQSTEETKKLEEDAEEAKNEKQDEKEETMEELTSDLKKELEIVQKAVKDKDMKISELTDHLRRALADTENVRDRFRREVESARQFAIQKFAKDMLNIADILNLALDAVPKEQRANSNNPQLVSLYEGVSLTEKELQNTFKRFGVEQFSPKDGDKFDHNLHHAMFEAPIPDKEPGTICNVSKTGYTLKGRVLRPAQVGVVKSPA